MLFDPCSSIGAHFRGLVAVVQDPSDMVGEIFDIVDAAEGVGGARGEIQASGPGFRGGPVGGDESTVSGDVGSDDGATHGHGFEQ